MRSDAHIKEASAVLLIVSSIVLAFVQALTINDVANGVLMYISQAFLLAGALFALDYYVRKIVKEEEHEKN